MCSSDLAVGTGVMGGMLAATFLAVFFVPLFYRLITDRRLREQRSSGELFEEIKEAHTKAHEKLMKRLEREAREKEDDV